MSHLPADDLAEPRNRSWRAIAAVTRLAYTRQRARPWRGALVAVGVAAAAAMLLSVYGGGTISADLKARQSIRDAPPAEQVVRVNWSGSELEGGIDALDASASEAIAGIAAPPVARSLLLRETNLGGGRGAVLAAVDDLGQWVALDSGRFPGPCRPERCEVMQVIGEPLDVRGARDANVVRVGIGHLTSILPFGDLAGRRAAAGAFSQTPVLVTGDLRGLATLSGLSFVFRTYGWAGALDPQLIHPWAIDELLRREALAAQTLASGPPGFGLTTPDQATRAARDASRSAARRMLVVGGAAAALLLGFALLAAGSLRADHAEELARLERRGAGAGVRLAFTVAERLWISLTGTVAGGVVAVLVVTFIARQAGVDATAILRHSILSPTGLAIVLAIWLGISVLLVASQTLVRGGDHPSGGHAVDVVIVAAVATVALAASRGGASAEDLAAGRDDPLLPALPVLLSLAAALLAIRIFGPLMRVAERRLRTAPLRVRLALLSLARRPGRAALTAAFLVVGCGLAVFAESYRATLDRGHRDQAAFAVPADVTIGDALTGQLLDALATHPPPAGATIAGILRANAGITGGSSVPVEGTLLGVPAPTIEALPGWRSDFSEMSRTDLARALRAGDPSAFEGVALPAGAAEVAMPATVAGEAIELNLIVRMPSGRTIAVPLRQGPSIARATIPAAARGGTLIALSAELTAEQQLNFGHATGEGRGGDIITGTLTLGALRVRPDDLPLTDWHGWVGRGGMRIAPGSAVSVRYAVDTDSRAVIRPPQRFDGADLPIAVSPDLGDSVKRGSRLTFRLAGGQSLSGTVTGILRRFPSLPDGKFVVADAGLLTAHLDANGPGDGDVNEVWISRGAAPDGSLGRYLATPDLAAFSVQRQADVESQLRADPLSRGVLITLSGAALAALALGVAALLLAALSDVRDERRELGDLETQGVPPALVRGQLRLRSAITMGFAVVGGLVLGIALSLLVVRLVLVSAGSSQPIPPLVRAGGWARIGFGLVGYVALGAVAITLATRSVLGRGADA